MPATRSKTRIDHDTGPVEPVGTTIDTVLITTNHRPDRIGQGLAAGIPLRGTARH